MTGQEVQLKTSPAWLQTVCMTLAMLLTAAIVVMVLATRDFQKERRLRFQAEQAAKEADVRSKQDHERCRADYRIREEQIKSWQIQTELHALKTKLRELGGATEDKH